VPVSVSVSGPESTDAGCQIRPPGPGVRGYGARELWGYEAHPPQENNDSYLSSN